MGASKYTAVSAMGAVESTQDGPPGGKLANGASDSSGSHSRRGSKLPGIEVSDNEPQGAGVSGFFTSLTCCTGPRQVSRCAHMRSNETRETPRLPNSFPVPENLQEFLTRARL